MVVCVYKLNGVARALSYLLEVARATVASAAFSSLLMQDWKVEFAVSLLSPGRSFAFRVELDCE